MTANVFARFDSEKQTCTNCYETQTGRRDNCLNIQERKRKKKHIVEQLCTMLMRLL